MASANKPESLNYLLRTKGKGGELRFSERVEELDTEIQMKIWRVVRNFTGNADADTGCVTVAGKEFGFRISALHPSGEFLSEDPANPKITKRVMTIVFADELNLS